MTSEWDLFHKWICRYHLWEVSIAHFGDEQRTTAPQNGFNLEFFSKCEDLLHLLISPVYICILHVYIYFLNSLFFCEFSPHFRTSTARGRGHGQGYGQGRKSVRACLCVFVLPGPFCHSSTSNPPEGDIVAVMNTDSCFLLHWDLSSVQIFGCRSFQRFKRVFDEIMQTWRPLKRKKLGSEHVVPVTASVLSTENKTAVNNSLFNLFSLNPIFVTFLKKPSSCFFFLLSKNNLLKKHRQAENNQENMKLLF